MTTSHKDIRKSAIERFAEKWVDLHKKQIDAIDPYDEDVDVDLEKEHVESALSGTLDEPLMQVYDQCSDQLYDNQKQGLEQFIEDHWDLENNEQQQLALNFLLEVDKSSNDAQIEEDDLAQYLEEKMEEYKEEITEQIEQILQDQSVEFYSLNIKLTGSGWIGSEILEIHNLDLNTFEFELASDADPTLVNQLLQELPNSFGKYDEKSDQTTVSLCLPMVSKTLKNKGFLDTDWQELFLLLQIQPEPFMLKLKTQISKVEDILKKLSNNTDSYAEELEYLSEWIDTVETYHDQMGSHVKKVYSLMGARLDFDPLTDFYYDQVCEALEPVIEYQSAQLVVGGEIDGEELQLIHNAYHSASGSMVGGRPDDSVCVRFTDPILLISDTQGYECKPLQLRREISVKWDSLSAHEEDTVSYNGSSRLEVGHLSAHMELKQVCGVWDRHYWQSCADGSYPLEKYLKKLEQDLHKLDWVSVELWKTVQLQWKQQLEKWVDQFEQNSVSNMFDQVQKNRQVAARISDTVGKCIEAQIQKQQEIQEARGQMEGWVNEQLSWEQLDVKVQKSLGGTNGLSAKRQAQKMLQMNRGQALKVQQLEGSHWHNALKVDPFGHGAVELVNKTYWLDKVSTMTVEQINSVDEMGRTGLMLAAARLDENALKKMLEAGADPTIKDQMGNSALDYLLYNLDQMPDSKVQASQWEPNDWLEAFMNTQQVQSKEAEKILPEPLQKKRNLLRHAIPWMHWHTQQQEDDVYNHIKSSDVWLVGCALGAPIQWVQHSDKLGGRVNDKTKAIGEYLHLKSLLTPKHTESLDKTQEELITSKCKVQHRL